MGGGPAPPQSGTTMVEANYSTAKISVWWDIETCHVAKESDAHSIAKNIQTAVANMGYRGPISIAAYGNSHVISAGVRNALSSTSITFSHVHTGAKEASDKTILVDMLLWAVNNPAPANYMLISGDGDFANALHQLCMRNYNILLAQPLNVAAPLITAATSVWLWTILSAGGPPLSKKDILKLLFISRNKNNGANRQKPADIHAKKINDPKELSSPDNSLPQENRQISNGTNNNQSSQPMLPNNISSKPTFQNQFLQPTRPNNFTYTPTYPSQFLQSQYQQLFSQAMRQNNFSSQTTFPNQFSQPVIQYNYFLHPYYYPYQFSQPMRPNNFSSQPTYPNQSSQPVIPDNFWSQPAYPNQFSQSIKPNNISSHASNPNQISQPITPDNVSLQPTFPHPSSIYTSNSTPNLGVQNITPNFGKLNISENSKSGQNVSCSGQIYVADQKGNYSLNSLNHPSLGTPQGNNLQNGQFFYNGNSSGLKCPIPSDYVQGSSIVILTALNTLKAEKICPCETNISDCICYGDLKNNDIDVKKSLEIAVEKQIVDKLNYGTLLYVGKNEKLWYFVTPLWESVDIYPTATWDKVHDFLASSTGQSAIFASRCRYEAAIFMKAMCLRDLCLGNIIQILLMAASEKKWIIHLGSGWHPLKITLQNQHLFRVCPLVYSQN